MVSMSLLVVVIASLVALLVVGTENMGSGHVAFANRGINVQTSTNQDQGCEPAGGTSGITNACTATSNNPTTPGTPVTLTLGSCTSTSSCNVSSCNSLGCSSVSCTSSGNCMTNNGIQLTSCISAVGFPAPPIIPGPLSCTVAAGTGITQSGGVIGDAG